jgi:hypothetical protein
MTGLLCKWLLPGLPWEIKLLDRSCDQQQWFSVCSNVMLWRFIMYQSIFKCIVPELVTDVRYVFKVPAIVWAMHWCFVFVTCWYDGIPVWSVMRNSRLPDQQHRAPEEDVHCAGTSQDVYSRCTPSAVIGMMFSVLYWNWYDVFCIVLQWFLVCFGRAVLWVCVEAYQECMM